MMRLRLRVVAVAAALLAIAAGGGAADIGLNDARMFNVVTGRADLADRCRPALARGLSGRGFSPVDLELVPRSGAAFAFWRRRSLAAEFSFQDGAAATRIDGVMACLLDSDEVHLEFRTSARPVRTTSIPGWHAGLARAARREICA